MKILITGGTGFIGLHTVRALLDAGHEVVSTQFRVRRDPPFVVNELGGRLQREIVDITSPYGLAEVMRKHRVEGIMHLAVPGVGAAALPPAEDYRSNMLSLLNVLDAALTFGVRRVVVASSVTVYDGTGAGPHRETDPLPVATTSATNAYKKTWEILAGHFADRAKLDVVCARIGYIYGPLYHSMFNILARMVHTAVRGGDLVKTDEAFAGDSFDYCYVKDCAAALALLQTAPQLRDRIYNVGSGRATSVAQIAEAVTAIRPGLHFALKAGKRDDLHGPENYMSLDAIARDTGYAPRFDIRSGVLDYADWLRGNEV